MDAPEEARIIERLAPAVLLMAKRLLFGQTLADAGDLAQCGLLRILETLRSGKTGTDWFLLQRAEWSMRKALAHELGRAAREPVSLDAPDMQLRREPAVFEDPVPDEEQPPWQRMMSWLNPREGQIVAAIHEQDLTQQQTAAAMNISQPRVHQIYQRALAKLRSRISGSRQAAARSRKRPS
jgi:RNA polymerase sigma factor (sigma-70 family)